MYLDGTALIITRGVLNLCRLRDEYYQFITDPAMFTESLRSRQVKADLFTFIQPVPDRIPKFNFHQEWDRATVLPLGTYEYWWKKQINDKTRNMVRKAQKTGVEVRRVDFGNELVQGIHRIYNESPVRQGRPFKHYGKDLETIRSEHGTFLERSEFLGAYNCGQLIGFAKVVYGDRVANLMNIISLISHRDKAPTNALIAKAVEACAGRSVPCLQYGTGNSGSIGEFKRHHGFEEVLIPRYFVPLNPKGILGLKLGFHRPLIDRVPENWRLRIAAWRKHWLGFRLAKGYQVRAVAQKVEQSAQA
jgi:hypothetical protein